MPEHVAICMPPRAGLQSPYPMSICLLGQLQGTAGGLLIYAVTSACWICKTIAIPACGSDSQ